MYCSSKEDQAENTGELKIDDAKALDSLLMSFIPRYAPALLLIMV